MKKHFGLLFIALLSITSYSQKYVFETVENLKALPVISQGSTGTCWSFSTSSFLESEIMRLSGKTIDISEMFFVRNTYLDKAENYVMRQGNAQFGDGGLCHDVINSAKKYGIAMQRDFSGCLAPELNHNHTKLANDLKELVKKVVTDTPLKHPNWKAEYANLLDTNLGKVNQIKAISAQDLRIDYKVNLNDYVTITTFTHAPFYSSFILNIPDNFANGSMYNLPLDEYIQNIDNALNKGFTLAIDTDVSEATFSGKYGVAIIPENEADATAIVTEIKPEKTITQDYRQAEFENYNTMDDHLMHIVGKVKDQKGNVYYKIKNSWGTKSGVDGFLYMSVPYMRLKSISVLLHKDGLTKKTKSTLGL
jgi:bleomycin hydrolase